MKVIKKEWNKDYILENNILKFYFILLEDNILFSLAW